jgi:hypothetical protein
MNPLKIRAERAAGDAGDLPAHTAQVLRLAATLDAVAKLRRFAADFTFSRHG